jgi:hypothetical protein
VKASSIWALVLAWVVVGAIVALVRNPSIIVQVLMGPLAILPNVTIRAG